MLVTISVNKMRIHGFHGVTEQERTVGTDFDVSVSIVVDMSPGVLASDSYERTVCYGDLTELIRHVMAQPRMLIETVAYTLYRAMIALWPNSEGGSISIAKRNPPVAGSQMESASVTLTWP